MESTVISTWLPGRCGGAGVSRLQLSIVSAVSREPVHSSRTRRLAWISAAVPEPISDPSARHGSGRRSSAPGGVVLHQDHRPRPPVGSSRSPLPDDGCPPRPVLSQPRRTGTPSARRPATSPPRPAGACPGKRRHLRVGDVLDAQQGQEPERLGVVAREPRQTRQAQDGGDHRYVSGHSARSTRMLGPACPLDERRLKRPGHAGPGRPEGRQPAELHLPEPDRSGPWADRPAHQVEQRRVLPDPFGPMSVVTSTGTASA